MFTLIGTLTFPDGTKHGGLTVVLVPTPGRFVDAGRGVVFGIAEGTTDATGAIKAKDGTSPLQLDWMSGMTYSIRVVGASGFAPYSFAVPATDGTTLDLADVTPLQVPTGLDPNLYVGVGVPAGGLTGQVLAKATNTDYDTAWVDGGTGGGTSGVSSVNGYTGTVTLAAADVGALPSTYVPAWADITGKPANYPPSAHTHPSTDLSDSTLVGRALVTAVDAAAARSAIGAGTSSLVLGTTAGTAAAGNDSRLSDARTPTAHASTHASAGSDPVTPAAIGAAATAHTHAAADVNSGTLAVARLGTGTPAAGTYVDGGTGAWTTLPAGGGGSSATPIHMGSVSVMKIGGHVVYSMTASRYEPCPLLVKASATITGMNVRVDAGVAGCTIDFALYTLDPASGTSSLVGSLGTVDASTSGTKTTTGYSLAVGVGTYFIVGLATAAVNVWGNTQSLMLYQLDASGGTNQFTRPYAGTGSTFPSSLTWTAGGINGAQIPIFYPTVA